MIIEQALKLKPGDWVTYPPDRGDPGGRGQVRYLYDIVEKNIQGQEYIRIHVHQPNLGRTSVWPSNRLS